MMPAACLQPCQGEATRDLWAVLYTGAKHITVFLPEGAVCSHKAEILHNSDKALDLLSLGRENEIPKIRKELRFLLYRLSIATIVLCKNNHRLQY